LILAFAFPGISQLLAWGQTSGLALVCFTLAYFALRARHDLLAGLAIGCLIFKPQLGLAAAVVFVLTQRWKVVLGALLSALLQMGIGWLYYGTAVVRDYLNALTRVPDVLPALEPRPYQMHSLRAFWMMLIPSPPLVFILYAVTAVGVLVLLVHCWRHDSDLRIKFSALLLASVLVSPHLTVYDLVVLAPAFLLLGDWAVEQPERRSNGTIRTLLYLCFPLFLLAPLVRFIHVQFSVIAMAALLFMISKTYTDSSAETISDTKIV
jgi:hypothetical protein